MTDESTTNEATKARLLLVEDEQHLAYTLEFNLAEEGYEVDLAENLEQARKLTRDGEHDLMILDVMLPDGNGFDFARQLREEGERVPILMLTAKGTSDDVVTGMEAGADDYVTKPFALEEVLARIRALLRRRDWESSDDSEERLQRFAFADAEIDFVRRRVSVQGRRIKLSDLELRLLRFFVSHPNEDLSRATLLEEVWDLPASTNTRTVDNFLVRLRRLFEKDPSDPRHFLTVRSVGYRFVP